jgi:hypothetical protein
MIRSKSTGHRASPLQCALVGARIIEAAENYARSDVPTPPTKITPKSNLSYYDDEHFWCQVLSRPSESWDARVKFLDRVIFSEWVARVPGLYWRPESEKLRRFSSDAVEGYDLGGATLRPYGKSQIVTGGVGTLKLPPSSEGYRLGTVTMTANVSAGVPVLLSPETWNAHHLREGTLIQIGQASWARMPIEWSARFPSTRGLPLGCLLLTDVDSLTVAGQGAAQIHPFTIMSYTDGAAELFDFVFATGNTGDRNHRGGIEEFFESYKDRNGRHGRYLIAADVAQPLWDAEYSSPAELSRANPAAPSHLKLLERRIQARLRGDCTEEDLLKALCSLPDVDYLRRISTQIGIEPSTWLTGGTLADAAAQFLSRVSQQQLPGLVESLAIEHADTMRVA